MNYKIRNNLTRREANNCPGVTPTSKQRRGDKRRFAKGQKNKLYSW